MNVNQLTQKSIEAVQAAQQTASERKNTEVAQAHLLALLSQPDGLIGSILTATGVDVNRLRSEAERRSIPSELQRRPGAEQVYVSQDLNNALNEAEKRAKEMGDSISRSNTCSLVCSRRRMIRSRSFTPATISTRKRFWSS